MNQHDNNTPRLESALFATIGAGIVTSFAIGQGQPPLEAFVITAIAVGFALVCQKWAV